MVISLAASPPLHKTRVYFVGFHGSATHKMGEGSGNGVRHSGVISIGERRIIFDPGYVQGSSGNDGLKKLTGVEAIIITHAHCDHWAGIANIALAYPGVPIFCTPPTEYFIRNALLAMPGIDKETCRLILGRIQAIKYKKETGICNGISFVFFSSGHMLGSAACLIKDCSTGNYLVTGDFSPNNNGVLPPFKLEDIISEGKIRGLVCEGSYVALTEPHFVAESEKRVEQIAERLEKFRPILFSIDRFGAAQNFLLHIMAQQRQNNMPGASVFMFNQYPRRIIDGSEPLVKQLQHAWSHFFSYFSLGYRQMFDLDTGQFRKTLLLVQPTGNLSMGDTFSRSILAMQTKRFKVDITPSGRFDTFGFGRDFVRSGGLVVVNHSMEAQEMITNLNLSETEAAGAFLFPPSDGHPYARMLENLIVESGAPSTVLVHGGPPNLRTFSREFQKNYGARSNITVALVGEPIEL